MEKLKLAKLEDILGYLYSVDEWTDIATLSLSFSYTKSTMISRINQLVFNGYVNEKIEGKFCKYHITDLGKEYIQKYGIKVQPREELKHKELQYEPVKRANETLGKIENIKKTLDKQIEEVDEIKRNVEIKAEALEKEIKKLKSATEKFYGRIGEIITLLIASISIIVFNIKVMDTTKIDFSKGYREAFLNIMAIDLPMIVLLVVATALFHYIVGKQLEIKKLIIPIIIIIVCGVTLIM